MINKNLLTPRNLLVIAVFVIVWQILLSRVNAYLHSPDQAA